MRPDQDVIDSDLSISSHRIVDSMLRGDSDQARRTIAAESRVLFLLGAAHVDREIGKVRSRRLSEPSVDRVVPLMAARMADGYGFTPERRRTPYTPRERLWRRPCAVRL